MPWKTQCAADQIQEFIAAHERGEQSVSELAEEFGISRKTGHKWLRRYADEGLPGLAERSRQAHHHPNALPAEVEELLLRGRELHPTWGPKKLVVWAARELSVGPVCAVSTVGEILKRHGLVVPRNLVSAQE